jgi:transcriptional regulator CtsR
MNKNPLANKISSALSESASDSGAVAIEIISLRPSENVAAMITTLNEVIGQPVSTMFLDAISERLYELLVESKNNETLILGLLEDVVVESDWLSPLSVKPSAQGSALALLVKRSAVNLDLEEYLKK